VAQRQQFDTLVYLKTFACAWRTIKRLQHQRTVQVAAPSTPPRSVVR
jgi:hypothetical protein